LGARNDGQSSTKAGPGNTQGRKVRVTVAVENVIDEATRHRVVRDAFDIIVLYEVCKGDKLIKDWMPKPTIGNQPLER
jgi:hypothetical protein